MFYLSTHNHGHRSRMLPDTRADNAASRSNPKSKLNLLANAYGHQRYFHSSSRRPTARLEDHSMQQASLKTARVATEATQRHGTAAQNSARFCIETPQRVRVRVNDPLLQSFFNVECKHSSATPDYIQRFRCILTSKWIVRPRLFSSACLTTRIVLSRVQIHRRNQR